MTAAAKGKRYTNTPRKIDRAAVAKSLRELALLFSGVKFQTAGKGDAHGEVGIGEAKEIRLPKQNSTAAAQAQELFGGAHG